MSRPNVAPERCELMVDRGERSEASVESKPYRRRPAAPFITSTFQQEAGRRLKLSAALAMHAAQGLYQKGYISYMRTDSTTLSATALRAARAEVVEQFGPEFLPDSPRTYEKKVRNAQEAHEAIRPAGDRFRHPKEVAGELLSSEARVYEMIWQRTVASQMTDAVGETVQVRFSGLVDAEQVLLGASGTMITHQGFRRAYVETDEETRDGVAKEQERVLPEMATGDTVTVAVTFDMGRVDATGNVGSVQFDLDYDATVFEAASGTTGVAGNPNLNLGIDGKVKFVKLNVDENPMTMTKYGVRGLPTLIMFKGGKVTATHLGDMHKDKLTEWVKTETA